MTLAQHHTVGIAAVVPARKGSVRLPNKNGLPFGDQDSLIAWKIAQLKQVLPADKIYLSTEAEDYKAIGQAAGVNIQHRSAELADERISPFSEVLHGVVSEIPHEHIAWCTVTSPLMSPGEYARAFELYNAHVIRGSHDSLMGVNLLKEYLWEEHKSLNYDASANHIYSQHLPNIYRLTNSIHMRDRESILRQRYHTGQNPYKLKLSKLAGIDIDHQEDYDMAVALYPLYQKMVL